MKPFVRHMILCDDAQRDPTSGRKVVIHGLVSTVRAKRGADFPLETGFSVYTVLTSCRGHGRVQITITSAEGHGRVYASVPQELAFQNDPLRANGVIIRLPTVRLPHPGLYWVELRYNGEVIAEQPLLAEDAR